MRTFAKVVGVTLLLWGIAALVPGAVHSDGRMLGFISANPAQNVLHILFGLLALSAGLVRNDMFTAFGSRITTIFLTLITLWGLPSLTHQFNGVFFGLIHLNWAAEILHMIFAIWGLYATFGMLAEQPVSDTN